MKNSQQTKSDRVKPNNSRSRKGIMARGSHQDTIMRNKTADTLKTLKDLQEDVYGVEMVEIWKLKAEAVKWVKDLPKAYYEENDILRNWIKHFFNLSEDDLK